MSKVYFPNLNALRFIAACMVIIHHIEQLKSIFLLDNYFKVPGIFFVGKLGVVLFFVLSGFLITYLLLKEKEAIGTIKVKQFYIRRILRIWPLYYFIIIIGLFVLPNVPFMHMAGYSESVKDNFFEKSILFGFFLPNVAIVTFPIVPFISHSWSVGVEEQFYLLWPLLLKKFKNIFKVLIGVIVFYFLIRISLLVWVHYHPDDKLIVKVSSFWKSFSIDCMAIGGLGAAILYNKKEKWLAALFNKYLQVAIYIIVLTLMIIGFHAPTIIHYEFYGVLFGILILNLAGNPNSIINLENKVLNYLGKISYGLYMYHFIAIVIILKLLTFYSISHPAVIYICCLLLTTIFAVLSYHFIEIRFIKAKKKHTVIESGEL